MIDADIARANTLLRVTQSLTPDLEDQISTLTDALLLLVRDEPDAVDLLRAVAEGLRFAASITAPGRRPVHVATGGLPS